MAASATGRKPVTLSLLDQIAGATPDLPRAFRRVGGWIIANPDAFMRLPLAEIARAAGVSEPTVVRFCRHFGQAGMAEFRIALALSRAGAPGAPQEPALGDKEQVRATQKRAIARRALGLVAEDRSIILDSGSTTALFAQELAQAAPLSILTTGLNVALALRAAAQHRVMLPGGTLRFDSLSLTGAMVTSALAGMRFDTLYLGADAIDPEYGLSTFNEEEARQNAAMIGLCRRVVVLADAAKFGAPALHQICETSRIDIIVTDAALPDTAARALTRQGVQVLRAPPEP